VRETSPERTYSLADAAALLGVSEARVRSFVDGGLLPYREQPGGRTFTFRDLVLLRSAKGLADRHIAPRRIRAALRGLGTQLPAGQSASSVSLDARGPRLVARDAHTSWEPETGQGVLDFSQASTAGTVHKLHVPAAPDVDVHFQQALALEEVDAAGAAKLYGEILRQCPTHVDAHVNLGRLHHGAGRLSAAEEHYRAAVAAQPADAVAAYNLAVALDDQGRSAEALAAYHQALQADPSLADAHYNLARLHEGRGERMLALRHLKEYRRLAS